MIEFECPHCQNSMKVPDDSEGKKGKCKKCGSEITVPPVLNEEISEDFGGITEGSVLDKFKRKRRIKLSYSSIVATVALFISLVALFNNPLGSGLGSYDLSSPESALKSRITMFQNDDLQARIDLNALPTASQDREKLNTLKIHKSSNHQADKVLWISYDKNGIKQFDVELLRKEPSSGLWYVVLGGRYQIKDSALDKAAADWIGKSGKVQE